MIAMYDSRDLTKPEFATEFSRHWPWLAGFPAEVGWELWQAGINDVHQARSFWWHYDEHVTADEFAGLSAGELVAALVEEVAA